MIFRMKPDVVWTMTARFRSTIQSALVVPAMAGEEDEKPDQWELIGNILSGLWNRVKVNMDWLWGRIKDFTRRICWLRMIRIVFPVTTGGVFFGWIDKIIPVLNWQKTEVRIFINNNSPRGPKEEIGDTGREKIENEAISSSPMVAQKKPTRSDQKQRYNKQYDDSVPASGTRKKPWAGNNPPLRNLPDCKVPAIYNDALDQFAIDRNSCYTKNQQGKNEIYCNMFVWDAAKVRNAETPHRVDKNGTPASMNSKYFSELSAHRAVDWLENYYAEMEWKNLTSAGSLAIANQGKSLITAWKNPTGESGQVVMVHSRYCSPPIGPYLTQAGWINYDQIAVGEALHNREFIFYYND